MKPLSAKSLVAMGFNYVIMSIIIILGGLVKPFEVLSQSQQIQISYPGLFPPPFYNPFIFILFIYHNLSIPYLFLSDYLYKCIAFGVRSKIIDLLSFDRPRQWFYKNQSQIGYKCY